MKLKKNDIGKLINTLTEIYNSLDEEEIYDFVKKKYILFPDKFIIKISEANKVEINRFLHKYCTHYIGYNAESWHCMNRDDSTYIGYPQIEPKLWAASFKKAKELGYEEINIEELKINYEF